MSSRSTPKRQTGRSRSATVHPCLPEAFFKDLMADRNLYAHQSQIFDPAFEKFRYDTVKIDSNIDGVNTSVSISDAGSGTLAIEGPSPLSSPAAQKLPLDFRRSHELFLKLNVIDCPKYISLLHMAVAKYDTAMAYEIVRMGVDLDTKNADGATPLFITLAMLGPSASALRLSAGQKSPVRHTQVPVHCMKHRIVCGTRIASMLIEQHVDVNAGAFGTTPLAVAAQAGLWDIVALLLKHGARHELADTIPFPNAAARVRYTSLLSQTIQAANLPRPPRPCPCWSGKMLNECHDSGEAQMWPSHFPCPCGRKRSYKECCELRGIKFVEAWSPRFKQILPEEIRNLKTHDTDDKFSPEMHPYIREGARGLIESTRNATKNMSPEEVEALVVQGSQERMAIFKMLLAATGQSADVDAAFWYAMDQTNFFPQPWENTISKVESRRRMIVWNAAVDEYLKKAGASHDRFEVEYSSKIAVDGGPLYKTCSAEGCKKIEKRDIPTLNKCSGCQFALYCGKDCQRASWKGHKKACRAGTMRPQMSLAQDTLDTVWLTMHATMGMHSMGVSPTEVALSMMNSWGN